MDSEGKIFDKIARATNTQNVESAFFGLVRPLLLVIISGVLTALVAAILRLDIWVAMFLKDQQFSDYHYYFVPVLLLSSFSWIMGKGIDLRQEGCLQIACQGAVIGQLACSYSVWNMRVFLFDGMRLVTTPPGTLWETVRILGGMVASTQILGWLFGMLIAVFSLLLYRRKLRHILWIGAAAVAIRALGEILVLLHVTI